MAKLEGYKYVAIIEISTGYSGKDYYYALYDESIKAGELVAVTGTANGQVFKVKDVLSIEEAKEKMPKNITAEVIGRVDTQAYYQRKENRERADKIRKQLMEKRKEIEARKDDEYYAQIDPSYNEMMKELRALSI